MSHHPAIRARRGFTLVEIMITLTMISVIGAAIISVFNSQQRFSRAASDVGNIRTQVQTATSIIAAELRNISASGDDIVFMSDSAIEVRSTIATSIVCKLDIPGKKVTLAPSGNLLLPKTGGGTTAIQLTSLLTPPAKGDGAFIWNEGPTAAASDDEWDSVPGPGGGPFVIDSVVVTAGACAATYAPAGNTAPATVLRTSTPLLATLQLGAAVRITRPVRYGLYQSTVDNQWYLGYRDPTLAAYQFVAGPLTSYVAKSDDSGLRLRYYDVNGAEITNYALRNTVARIDIRARARTATASSLGGGVRGKIHEDWLLASVSIRNRN